MLPADRIPSFDEFRSLPYYDRTVPEFVGNPYFMGYDEHGNNIYFMGMWNQRKRIAAAITAMLDGDGVDPGRYFFQDAFPLINFSTKLGGLLSKRYCLTKIGRLITIWGMRRQYLQFVDLVQKVKKGME